jgi:hypothetical protein
MLFGGESDHYGAHYRADAIKPQRFGGAGVVTMIINKIFSPLNH